MQIPTVTHLSNSELKVRLEELRVEESKAISDFVLHLSEIDSRGYYRELGYSSIYTYMTQGHGYSEGAAHRRISAARCLKSHPEVYLKLREGKLSLCTVSEITKVSTEVRGSLLSDAEGRSKREVQQMVAAVLPPEELKRESIRVHRVEVPVEDSPLFKAKTPPSTPAVEERYTVTFEADKEFMQELEQARALLGVKSNAEILKRALRALVAKRTPAKSKAKRAASKSTRTRYIPKAVRAEVYARDNAQCTYIGVNGRRCSERHGLQFEHCEPFALGGTNEASNLRLLCPAHNQLSAEIAFGREKIRAYRKKASPKSS